MCKIVKTPHNSCVLMEVVNCTLRVMYSICVGCNTPKNRDTLVDKRGILLYLANEDYIKHTDS